MIGLVRMVITTTIIVWKTDREEFWEILGGVLQVIFWTIFLLFVLLPIFGD